MVKVKRKPVYTKIPTKLTNKMFDEFFLPHLSMPKRGPKCKIGYFRIVNYNFKVLYTGMQWEELTINVEPDDKPEIHYNGFVISPFTIAPVNKNDCILLPDSLSNLSRITRESGISIKDSTLNLDRIFDSRKNRKDIYNRGMIPNIPKNKRNRKKTKRGHKRLFNQAIHAIFYLHSMKLYTK